MANVAINTYGVTDEQIGKAHKVFGPDNKPFYLVENSKGDVDETDHLIEYSVKALKRQGKWHLTCDCKAGSEGRNCWHKRASQAAAAEEKAAMAEQVALNEVAKVEPVPAKPRQKASKDGERLYQSRMRGIADIIAAKRMASECMPHANQK